LNDEEAATAFPMVNDEFDWMDTPRTASKDVDRARVERFWACGNQAGTGGLVDGTGGIREQPARTTGEAFAASDDLSLFVAISIACLLSTLAPIAQFSSFE
jgi:hypothetical protein